MIVAEKSLELRLLASSGVVDPVAPYVYFELSCMAQGIGAAFTNGAEIAASLQRCARKVRKAISQLIDLGFVKASARRGNNRLFQLAEPQSPFTQEGKGDKISVERQEKEILLAQHQAKRSPKNDLQEKMAPQAKEKSTMKETPAPKPAPQSSQIIDTNITPISYSPPLPAACSEPPAPASPASSSASPPQSPSPYKSKTKPMTIGQARTAGEKKKAIALTDEWEEFYEKLGVTQVWNCGNLTELFREIHSRFQPSQLCPQLIKRMTGPDIALKARRNYFLSALSTYDKKTGAYQLREGSKFLKGKSKEEKDREEARRASEKKRRLSEERAAKYLQDLEGVERAESPPDFTDFLKSL